MCKDVEKNPRKNFSVYLFESEGEFTLKDITDVTATVSKTYFFGIYWDLLKNLYAFRDKSHTI